MRGVPGLDLIDLNDAGVKPSEEEEGIEAFDTFAENAVAKARYFRERTGLPTVADDSGIVVDALDGAPGVRSKRFSPDAAGLSGEERDRDNLQHLLRLLGDLPLARRTGRYVCVAALDMGADEEPHTFTGTAEGLILGRPRGRGGFGYDPIFFDQHTGKSFAELTPAEKDAISHRGGAFRELGRYLSGSTLEGAETS